eukprot:4234912-Pyramimonas_sp.AAC.1
MLHSPREGVRKRVTKSETSYAANAAELAKQAQRNRSDTIERDLCAVPSSQSDGRSSRCRCAASTVVVSAALATLARSDPCPPTDQNCLRFQLTEIVPAHALAFSPSGELAVSTAPTERHVAVWECTTSGGSSKRARGAAAVLSMEHPAVQLTTHEAPGAEAEFFVVAVSQ